MSVIKNIQRYKRWIIASVAILLLAAMIGFMVLLNMLDDFEQQPLMLSQPQVFQIKAGESARKVVSNVQELAQIQPQPQPKILTRIWLKLNSDKAQFKAGYYDILPGETLSTVMQKFHQGQTKKINVTLIEGQTWSEWKTQLISQPWLVNDIDERQLLGKVQQLYQELKLTSLEGMLMPDTYHLEVNTKLSEVVLLAATKMHDFIQAEWQNRAVELPLSSSYEALILASIIEKETGMAEERPHIAAVFVNRLNQGMRLQTDPTVIYGLGDAFDGNLTRAHLRAITPYNTYRMNGLPPTPIAMSSRASIIAALNPLQSSDLYFVARGDGSHQFSVTLQEHNAAVRRYQLGK
ncbi:endolytic transglycosylase MltG [Paraneptunicella aestuarii]|uniref:endolytic transglycosylase MltG n=1 Tax=Paraneptunicella aestuarii TaxID=2831148 RepID=UPI001E4D6417|nr:endolytic transglycosylase MltG [Paraneptunicella aestuarii]UAA40413.1 endolytic transglycosylase MltG [Paraneptunicella aestuarii]